MKKTRKNKEKFTEPLLMCLCAVIFFVSIWKLYGILKEYRNGTQEYEAISQQRIYRIWLQFFTVTI